MRHTLSTSIFWDVYQWTSIVFHENLVSGASKICSIILKKINPLRDYFTSEREAEKMGVLWRDGYCFFTPGVFPDLWEASPKSERKPFHPCLLPIWMVQPVSVCAGLSLEVQNASVFPLLVGPSGILVLANCKDCSSVWAYLQRSIHEATCTARWINSPRIHQCTEKSDVILLGH